MNTKDRIAETILNRVQRYAVVAIRPYRVIRGNRGGEIGLILLVAMIAIAIIGPEIAPYSALEKDINDMGVAASMEEPSAEHPFGTTRYGRDIFSQTLIGAQTALLIGFSTATIVVVLGTTVGVVSGYFGGRVDDLLMRITDVVYGIPILPFAIVALTILDRSLVWIILVIGLLYWRNSARIIRSDVLSLRDEEFIQKAKTTGASDRRILRKQVIPNILPISFLYFAFATGFAIIMSASIAFLGFGDPNRISWGRMIFAAWNNNGVFQQPLWVAAPGLMIVFTVASVYLIGQTYEEVANPRLKDR
jgi:peptide/nickel transport system permease protein